jgi:hypothetical protein
MNYLNDLKKFLDKYYVKFPALPKGLKDFIVSITPWLTLIFAVLAIITGISAFGALSFVSPFAAFAGVRGYAYVAIVSAVILLLQGIIELMAFSPLKANKARGWNLLYYSLLLGVVSSIVTLNVYTLLNSLIGVLIGYYVLYQIKTYYK